MCKLQGHYTFILIVFGFLLISCKSEKQESISSQEADTRIWVKQAYDTLDYMKVGAPWNQEKVNAIRQMVENEPDPGKKMSMNLRYAQELLKNGQTQEAIDLYNTIFDFINKNNIKLDSMSSRNLYSMLAVAYLRHGEIENCVRNHNHESCFIPIAGGGIHELTYGSDNAIRIYQKLLEESPNDLESQYLLNLAYMTLDQYPEKVPARFRINPSWFDNRMKIQPFRDIAPEIGLNRRGHAGGVVVDDFTNDGWLDLVITSWSPNEALIFYVNNGDGSFTDKTSAFGLDGQVGILNLNQTDFNNDGWLDLYLMRGAWLFTQGDIPNTLLMNTGKGGFEDVTLKAGLTKHAPGQTAAWSDFNLDGHLDLVIANESLPEHQRGIDLYMNQGDGTFVNEALAYGLNLNHFFKGCVATDVNNDRYPDIYMSSQYNGNTLFINQGASGQKKFVALGPETNPGQPMNSFPCWNFDFDNDGNEDLFVSGYTNDGNPATHWMQSNMNKPDVSLLPKLYHNEGNLQFKEVGMQMGLTEIAFTMGCNFGDINTDGYLDFYLSTGNPQYQSIIPNKMYLNVGGKRFADVSYSGGFANIQKGHGVGFGDLDHDGDEDMYVVIGGAFDGDAFYNCLFENPNEFSHNWVVLRLEGTSCNKSAIGARVSVSVNENGKETQIHRTVTSGASFGANSLCLEVGLGKATTINQVNVQWPCKDCPQESYTGIEINKSYVLTQGQNLPRSVDYNKVAFKAASGHSHHH